MNLDGKKMWQFVDFKMQMYSHYDISDNQLMADN